MMLLMKKILVFWLKMPFRGLFDLNLEPVDAVDIPETGCVGRRELTGRVKFVDIVPTPGAALLQNGGDPLVNSKLGPEVSSDLADIALQSVAATTATGVDVEDCVDVLSTQAAPLLQIVSNPPLSSSNLGTHHHQ